MVELTEKCVRGDENFEVEQMIINCVGEVEDRCLTWLVLLQAHAQGRLPFLLGLK